MIEGLSAASVITDKTRLPTLICSAWDQLVDYERLDEDRTLEDEAGTEFGLLDQSAEHVQVGIRGEHHIDAPVRF